MKFKGNVHIYHFTEMKVMQILQAVQATVPENYEPTVTSANDSKHKPDSLHYQDRAFDIRVKDYPGFDLNRFEETRWVIDEWIARMREILNEYEYDIVFGDAKHRNHIHIEFDPKY